MKLLKKMFCLLLVLTLVASCAFAEGGINVTKKDINLNKTLDKNVTNILVLLQDRYDYDRVHQQPHGAFRDDAREQQPDGGYSGGGRNTSGGCL